MGPLQKFLCVSHDRFGSQLLAQDGSGQAAPAPHARQIHLKHVLVFGGTELLTKKDMQRNAKNLIYFDAVIFAGTIGELDMDASQKQDFSSSIKDDGEGFAGIHAALDTNYTWPGYGEMFVAGN